MKEVEIVKSIRERLSSFGSYPPGLNAGSGVIRGTAFFPGGDGLVYPRLGEAPLDIAVVGHDFGTLSYFSECVVRGEERMTQATWSGLRKRFDAAAIDLQRCFFTNVFLGYRSGGSNSGPFAAASDKDYASRCRDFLGDQINAIQPRVIVALGNVVPSVLARISPDLKAWRSATTMAAIDRAGSFVGSARFGSVDAAVCAITHPSYARLNAKTRRYVALDGCQFDGEEAEVRLLRDGLLYADNR